MARQCRGWGCRGWEDERFSNHQPRSITAGKYWAEHRWCGLRAVLQESCAARELCCKRALLQESCAARELCRKRAVLQESCAARELCCKRAVLQESCKLCRPSRWVRRDEACKRTRGGWAPQAASKRKKVTTTTTAEVVTNAATAIDTADI
jgi:hypothetical protein